MQDQHRILTSHVGSLIRPPELIAYYKTIERALNGGPPVDRTAFEDCVSRSVGDAVERQAELGIDIVSDGEFGKSWLWANYTIDRISGLEQRELSPGEKPFSPIFGKDRRDFADFYAEYDRTRVFFDRERGRTRRWTVTGPIKYVGHAAVQRDIANLKQALGSVAVADAFITAVSPGSMLPERDDRYYRDEEEALFAIADALREEYRAIVEAGFILQIDDAYLASWYDMMLPDGTLADYRKWVGVRIAALNHALQGLPENRTRVHVCWGSWSGPHSTDVPLEAIVDLILTIRTGGYVLESANVRHEHEWHVWEDVKLPDGRYLMPGVVSHHTNLIEHPKLVAERIVRLARLVGRESVIAGTDCGFSPGPFQRRFHPSIMWAKLETLVAGAKLATKELWDTPSSRA
jgi:5-methyltetrahydropteroyltriglutamate--homocysteine methyltransferase